MKYITSGRSGIAATCQVETVGSNHCPAVKFRTAEIVSFRPVCGPLLVLLLVHMAAVIQFIHIASPILPEVTVCDVGMDGVLGS